MSDAPALSVIIPTHGRADTLRLTLGEGLRADTRIEVKWPGRTAPTSVTVDGRTITGFDAEGLKLARPFKTLEARW